MNIRGCNLDILGQPVTTYLLMPRSMCAQSSYCLSLLSCGCMCSTFVSMDDKVIGICSGRYGIW